jgi:hypothetical protein
VLIEAMNPDESMHSLANQFESIFQRLLAGEKLDLYEENLSFMFEVIAAELLAEVPERKFCWYDGVDGLTASVRKSLQVEFKGEMWVGDEKTQWEEDFRARVTDKRLTKQGLWITIWVGPDKAEGELLSAFGITEEI